MPARILSLYEICLDETALLLKNSYWNINFPYGYNPFILVPSFIVDALIVRVVRLSVSLPLESSDLRLLLVSGRVREFVLEDITVSDDCLREIFMDLSSACDDLVKIKIKNVFCNIVHRVNLHMKSYALNCLLSEARNVKYVESCIEFNLEVLCNSIHLETLVLNFPIEKNCLFDCLLEINGQLVPHTSLRHLEVFEDPRHPVSHLEVAMILTHCPELVDISCDICKSLVYLHRAELLDGSLTAEYKIQKCCLGSVHFDPVNAVASRDGVYIASLTCPYLKDVCMLVNDDQAIYALSDLHNLKTLLIQWEPLEFGDFTFGVQLLLEKPEIGPNLTSLDLLNFGNIDFASIGIACPNLEMLRIEYASERNRNEFSPTSFKKLRRLNIENIEDNDCHVDTLIGLLSNATDLKSLTILFAGRLRDDVLRDILRKNSLSKVKDLRLSRCVLSIDGIRNLACSLTALEYFDLNETHLNVDEVAAVIHEINPRVIVSSTLE